MPRKPLVKLQEGLDIQQDPDWCGVYALARAQQADSAHMPADLEQNGPRRQYGGNVMEQVIQAEVHDGLRQNRDDIPLVEQA